MKGNNNVESTNKLWPIFMKKKCFQFELVWVHFVTEMSFFVNRLHLARHLPKVNFSHPHPFPMSKYWIGQCTIIIFRCLPIGCFQPTFSGIQNCLKAL